MKYQIFSLSGQSPPQRWKGNISRLTKKMGSNFQNSRNYFSVKVVYPSKENHAQHQTAQSTPTDSTLKLRGHLWNCRCFHTSLQQKRETPDFCWRTSDVINTDLRAVSSSWCCPLLSHPSPPALNSGHPKLTWALAASSPFGSPRAWPCVSTRVFAAALNYFSTLNHRETIPGEVQSFLPALCSKQVQCKVRQAHSLNTGQEKQQGKPGKPAAKLA